MEELPKTLVSMQSYWVGVHSIHLDNFSLTGCLINSVLEGQSDKRAYIIIHEDAIRATGVWTLNEAVEVANRLIVGPDGNFTDPKLRKGLLRPLQYLGFIS